MIAFVIRRLLQAVLVMMAVGFVAFSLFAYVGDPVSIMLGQDFTEESRQRLVTELGLDKPFFVQYFNFLVNAAQGQFGISYRLARPVTELLRERLPATLELSLCAAVLALAVGVPMGVYTGLNRDTWLSRLLLTVSLVGVSLPTFLIGILLILVFSVVLGWLPSFGRGTTVALGWWTTGFLTPTGLRALILPSITLALFQMTLIMRLVRSEMLEVLRTDYIKFARARGLHNRAINFGHALKNTLVPVITITGLRHRHRNRVPVARHGLPVHPVGQLGGHPGDGGLPAADRVLLRRDQPDRRPAVLRSRPAPARRPRGGGRPWPLTGR